jgi:hypothetical protein
MADDKKKDAGGGDIYKDLYKEVLYFLLPGLLVLALILQRLSALLENTEFTVLGSAWAKIAAFFLGLWAFWKVASVIMIAIAIYAWFYSSKKLKEIEQEEEKIYGKKVDEAVLAESGSLKLDKSDEKWQKIVTLANSENPAEWRVAIIEADIMLEDLLRASGYPGDGVGDMLKGVEVGDMLTLDAAWEAHKVRNRIAHSGSDFALTDRETRRVVSLFEAVFREFGII